MSTAFPCRWSSRALLLASLRRLVRPADVPPLPRIRSLAYFQPVIEELQEHPAPDGYLEYLRLKLRSVVDKADPAKVQKSTFSDDREQTKPDPSLRRSFACNVPELEPTCSWQQGNTRWPASTSSESASLQR